MLTKTKEKKDKVNELLDKKKKLLFIVHVWWNRLLFHPYFSFLTWVLFHPLSLSLCSLEKYFSTYREGAKKLYTWRLQNQIAPFLQMCSPFLRCSNPCLVRDTKNNQMNARFISRLYECITSLLSSTGLSKKWNVFYTNLFAHRRTQLKNSNEHEIQLLNSSSILLQYHSSNFSLLYKY